MTEPPAADLVFLGGPILTLDGWEPGADTSRVRDTAPTALAIRGDRIIAVGDEDSRALIGPSTRVVALDGRCVIPGIADAHLHFNALSMARGAYIDVSPTAVTEWSQLSTVLTRDAVGPDGWIRAHGWSEIALGRCGTKDDVDRALLANGILDVPTVLFDWSGHTLVAGTAALQRAGIERDTPVPTGGMIQCDERGEPTGLVGDGAMALVTAAMPPIDRFVRLNAYRSTQRELHSLGITALTEPGLGPGAPALLDGTGDREALETLAKMARDGELTLRIGVLLLFTGTGGANRAAVAQGIAGPLRHVFDGLDPTRLRISGVKVFSDGVPMNHTCWFHEPYGDENDRGALVVVGDTEQERLEELSGILEAIDDAGLRAGVHAIGDASADAVVEILARIERTRGGDPRRHYLIHASVVDPGLRPRMAAAGIGLAANPVITRLGRDERPEPAAPQNHHEPLRSLLHAGVTVSTMTDSPIVHPDWRPNLVHAVRRSQLYRSPRPDDTEGVSGIDALAMLTVMPARQENAEHLRGALRPGMLADLVVLDGPWPDDEDVEGLLTTQTHVTVIGGRIVFDAATPPVSVPSAASVGTRS
ncbi:putative amidohydrolase YtcJ [Microbacterium sp. SORGH_AS 1204]|uniref:amidohydrolase n=1 Tax=Microbacterium sp. SORGH_AS_1204 TaxID=3041785 RepID=UPI0027934689|nr:amidohydrolase family protein [Microbacterium sp. SORGH_AS_1204]MDQ1136301.1 putative amidohydrolase YtcJ [Microbacterium sp. SORGH_AS_1204]